MREGSCPICGSSNREYICQSCASAQILQAKSQQLHNSLDQLRQQKAVLLQSLEKKLAVREAFQTGQVRKWRQLQDLKAAQARAQRVKDTLAQAQQQLSNLTALNASRRKVLEQLSQQTAKARAQRLGNELPTILRYETLTLSHVKAMLEREQRLKLRQLTEIFPLRINAVRPGGGPIQITICNLRLPESGNCPAGGWPEPEGISAALGYLLLLVDKVGLIMGGPMLHESLFQGSTSSIWQPASFWNRQPGSPSAMLPLHVLGSSQGSSIGAGQAAFNGTSGRYLTTANFFGGVGPSSTATGTAAAAAAAAASAASAAASAAAAAFSRATGYDGAGFYAYANPGNGGALPGGAAGGGTTSAGVSGSGGSSNPPEPGGGRGSSRQGSDFKAAWDLLQRSLACFLKDKSAKDGFQLPAPWTPLAWLVLYCAVVKRDMRQDGKLVALSSRVDAAAAAAAAAAAGGGEAPTASRMGLPGDGNIDPNGLMIDSSLGSMVVGAAGAAAAAADGGDAPGLNWDEGDEEEDDEGWVVQTPFLPPPPSQPDEVEHWARAMFADGNALASNSQASSSLGYHGLGLGFAGIQRGLGHASGGLARAGVAGAGNVALGSSPSGSGMMSMERIRLLFSR